MSATNDAVSFNINRQLEIYREGTAGRPPAYPVAFEALAEAAKAKMSPEAWAFADGGAGSEKTLRANVEAFERWQIVPRMLAGVAQRDLSVTILGQKMRAPVLLAPIGVQELYDPGAETASARAAAAAGVPFVLSTVASRSIEDVAAAMGDAPRWFQLYWSKDPEIAASLIRRAEKAGYSHLVVTLDTMILGWRPRDLQLGHLPFLHGRGLANYISDPVFRAGLPNDPEEDIRGAVNRYLDVFSNPALTWKDIAFLREITDMPILLKGINHIDDARLAVEHGIDGIIVSNHGGRQVDGAISTLESLPAVLDGVNGAMPVLLDGGIRSAADAFKAMALGASAILLGRPFIYALAVGGESAVRDLLENFLAELDVTLALSGHSSWVDVNQADLRAC